LQISFELEFPGSVSHCHLQRAELLKDWKNDNMILQELPPNYILDVLLGEKETKKSNSHSVW